MEQKFLSAETSINATKLPKAYTAIDKLNSIRTENIMILDYGCGRYTDHLRKHFNTCDWYGYDLTWNNDEKLLNQNYHLAICSNVLNVIAEDEIIDSIILNLVSVARKTVISIYEGNGSGIGKETKKGCYQRNEKLDKYYGRCIRLGLTVQKTHGVLIVEK